ncbi:Mss4-like protein [Pelagophyceae sp. CCMP2097]|nr:Mss4-like protein [Pelagophyceae sp. CCMP2097]|mmetsp:Transcript_9652/g.31847  ORF Transcript_9652/g.31847 Transcript_9652/m.31847 type:complete len:169 (-) Transcript_9652:105-611(-)
MSTATETVTCYCGQTSLTLTGAPAMQVWCHCHSCRSWGGGAAQAAKLYPFDNVAITGSAKYPVLAGVLADFPATLKALTAPSLVTRDPAGKAEGSNSWRFSCANCGGAVVDNKKHMGLYMVPAGLSDSQFTPTLHLCYEEKICSVKDGLPKYCTAPAGFGGDDKTMAE